MFRLCECVRSGVHYLPDDYWLWLWHVARTNHSTKRSDWWVFLENMVFLHITFSFLYSALCLLRSLVSSVDYVASAENLFLFFLSNIAFFQIRLKSFTVFQVHLWTLLSLSTVLGDSIFVIFWSVPSLEKSFSLSNLGVYYSIRFFRSVVVPPFFEHVSSLINRFFHTIIVSLHQCSWGKPGGYRHC